MGTARKTAAVVAVNHQSRKRYEAKSTMGAGVFGVPTSACKRSCTELWYCGVMCSVQAPAMNMDADLTPEEIQMMQAMGIPFAFSTTQGQMVGVEGDA
jgi:hypothetical protein